MKWYFHMNNGDVIPFSLMNNFETEKLCEVEKWIANQYAALGKWYSTDNKIINLDNVSYIAKS